MSKRQVLEEAIQLRAARLRHDERGDVWGDTLGAWERRESGPATIQRARRAFQQSFERRHGTRRARVRR